MSELFSGRQSLVGRSKPEVTIISYQADTDVFQKVFIDGLSAAIGKCPYFIYSLKKVASALRETVAFGHYTGSDAPEKDAIVLYRPKHLQTKLEADSAKYDGDVKKVGVTNSMHY